MTSKADSLKRLVIPQAEPGQEYSIQENPDGSLTLISISESTTPPPKCRVVKEKGFTVAVPEQPINEKAIQEMLAEFP